MIKDILKAFKRDRGSVKLHEWEFISKTAPLIKDFNEFYPDYDLDISYTQDNGVVKVYVEFADDGEIMYLERFETDYNLRDIDSEIYKAFNNFSNFIRVTDYVSKKNPLLDKRGEGVCKLPMLDNSKAYLIRDKYSKEWRVATLYYVDSQKGNYMKVGDCVRIVDLKTTDVKSYSGGWVHNCKRWEEFQNSKNHNYSREQSEAIHSIRQNLHDNTKWLEYVEYVKKNRRIR